MLGSSSMIRTLVNLCFSYQREENRETTSLSDVAFDRDGSVMRFDNVLYQRQAQATAFDIMDQPVADTVKLLENLCVFSAWNANAVIHDFNSQIRSTRFGRDRKLLHLA